MALSNELISQFVKATKDTGKKNDGTVLNGTVKIVGGKEYVQLDGSDLLTPITKTVAVSKDERVSVTIKDHSAIVTGNLSSPAAKDRDVQSAANKISEFEIIVAYRVTAEDVSAVNIMTSNLTAKVAELQFVSAEDIEAAEADIETIRSKLVGTETLTAVDIQAINADITNLKAKLASFEGITTSELEAINADIGTLNAYTGNFTYVSTDVLDAQKARIEDLEVNKLSADEADLRYADIEFANIDMAAVKNLFSDSGIIKDLVVSEGKITGELVGVTIKGDLIEANSLKADKLVVLGEDGLYYKLNVNSLGETTASSDPKYQNGLDGSAIIAQSIVAEKIAVTDLVAFGATIGGFHIGDHSLYSGAKSSAGNTTRGVFLGDDGQFAVGDSNNYLKFYKDENNNYKLDITAQSLKINTTSGSQSIDDYIEEKASEYSTEAAEEASVPVLRINSSRGTVFKNNSISTVLTVSIYKGANKIENISALRSIIGSTAHLQWYWQRLDDESFGTISSSDKMLSDDGFALTISADEVDTKVTFMCELIT